MRKSVMYAALAAIVGGGAIACKTVGSATFREPVVRLKEMQLRGIGLTGGEMDVILSVYNPNGFNLDATRLTYNLFVDDSIQFGSGTVNQRFTVQERDSSMVTLPLRFTYAGIGNAGRQLLNTGTLNYRVTGDVTVGTPLGNFTRPYDQRGRYTMTGNR